MKERLLLTLLAAALSQVLSAHADDVGAGATLHQRVMSTYDFLPRNLDKPQIAAKSKVLDAFWSDVKAQGPAGLDALRQELQRTDLPVFFNYDGAKLLLSLSQERADRALALTAISRAELRDIQWADYFYTVHGLAVDGLDTSDAALKILGDDNFTIFVPQHVLTLGQDFCLLYMLMPTDEKFWLEKLEQRLFREQRVKAQKSILLVLGYAVDEKADDAIKRFAADTTQPEEARAYARDVMAETRDYAKTPLIGMSFSSFEGLKAERRKLLAHVSDEALDDLETLQAKLRAKAKWMK